MESLRALLSGGIAFAAPDSNAPPAIEGADYTLNAEPKKGWLAWSAAIPITPTASDDGDNDSSAQIGRSTSIDVKSK